MITTQNIMERLSGKWMVQELEEYLEEHFDTFAEVQNLYISAVKQLKNELGEVISPSVDDVVDAIERQMSSILFFSAIQGIKANLNHFRDPMARTVLDVDFEVFLQEDTARRLPAYVQARREIESFYSLLTLHQKEQFGNVIEYITYIETYGPKLAHYFGYMLGNAMLPCLVLGYYSDPVQTIRYRSVLTDYLGCCGLLSEE